MRSKLDFLVPGQPCIIAGNLGQGFLGSLKPDCTRGGEREKNVSPTACPRGKERSGKGGHRDHSGRRPRGEVLGIDQGDNYTLTNIHASIQALVMLRSVWGGTCARKWRLNTPQSITTSDESTKAPSSGGGGEALGRPALSSPDELGLPWCSRLFLPLSRSSSILRQPLACVDRPSAHEIRRH